MELMENTAIIEAAELYGDRNGDAILAKPGDPDYESIAAVLPQNNSWDFIGTLKSKWKFLIGSGGRITIETTVFSNHKVDYRKEVCSLFDPAEYGLEYAGLHGQQTLVDGFLPVSRMNFMCPSGNVWYQTAFAAEINDRTVILLKIYEQKQGREFYYRINAPDCSTLKELMTLPPPRAERLAGGSLFETEIGRLRDFWKHELQAMVSFTVPEERIMNGVKAGLIKALLSQVNGVPKYGVTRYFCDTEEDRNCASFPPTTITLANCLTSWGLFEPAANFLGYHLDNFVNEEGALVHRKNGAALSEHGMMLDAIAYYLETTGDYTFLEKHSEPIKNIIAYLLKECASRNQNEHDLLKGCAEDDTRFWKASGWYSGNLWVCRGISELVRVFKNSGIHKWTELTTQMEYEAVGLRSSVLSSIQNSVIKSCDPWFIPPCPEWTQPFEHMTEDTCYPGSKDKLLVSSYTNYRFYPEMLSAGIMNHELSEIILKFRKVRGGEFLGITRFKPHNEEVLLDDWPLYNQLWALLNLGKAREFLLALYAHMAHHQGRYTFFAPESTGFDQLDSIHCVPSQLTVPLAVRWMLVFEERDQKILHLNRAAPSYWSHRTGAEISIKHAPTRWGSVSYQLKKVAAKEIIINVKTDFKTAAPKIVFYLRGFEAYKKIRITSDIDIQYKAGVLNLTPDTGDSSVHIKIDID